VPHGDIYIPKTVKDALRSHIGSALAKATRGLSSAIEDEDAVTGHLGSALQITPEQKVFVREGDYVGEWTWSIDYAKLRGRGRRAAEATIGADGIFEIRLAQKDMVRYKSLLFQAKTDWSGTDKSLFEQVIKLSTWREAACVVNYRKPQIETFKIEDVIASRGKRQSSTVADSLENLLARDFLDCDIGDVNLFYDKEARQLIWRTMSGERVGCKFLTRHIVSIKISDPYGKQFREIAQEDIHNNRMYASDEVVLGIPKHATKKQMQIAFRRLALIYHPDKIDDPLLDRLFTRRMQEVNAAYFRSKTK
jgi:hypothetical protein